MSEAARSTPAAQSSSAFSDRDAALQERPEPDVAREVPGSLRHNRFFMADQPLMSWRSDRAEVEDTLDLQALAWVDAFRDHGFAVCFDKIRDEMAKGNDQIIPMFLSEERVHAMGLVLQAYRDRISELRYLTGATAGPPDRV